MKPKMDERELKQRIDQARTEMLKCGPIHRRDLQKYVNRLKKQIRICEGGNNG